MIHFLSLSMGSVSSLSVSVFYKLSGSVGLGVIRDYKGILDRSWLIFRFPCLGLS